jgi:hypothetical protein
MFNRSPWAKKKNLQLCANPPAIGQILIEPIGIREIGIVFRFQKAQLPIDIVICFCDATNNGNFRAAKIKCLRAGVHIYRMSEDRDLFDAQSFICDKVEFSMSSAGKAMMDVVLFREKTEDD